MTTSGKHICGQCGRRRAIVLARNGRRSVRAMPHHDLCPKCYRAIRDGARPVKRILPQPQPEDVKG
jgi:hypothetical protein